MSRFKAAPCCSGSAPVARVTTRTQVSRRPVSLGNSPAARAPMGSRPASAVALLRQRVLSPQVLRRPLLDARVARVRAPSRRRKHNRSLQAAAEAPRVTQPQQLVAALATPRALATVERRPLQAQVAQQRPRVAAGRLRPLLAAARLAARAAPQLAAAGPASETAATAR